MGEDFKRKIGDAVDEHGDKIDKGLDKAAEAADNKTGGKYSDKIASGADKAKEFLGGLSSSDEDTATGEDAGEASGDETTERPRRDR